jgi:hypothetical protein
VKIQRNWLLIALCVAILVSAFAPPAGAAPAGVPGPAKDVPLTLYGSAAAGSNGWGYGPANITQPGPTITVPRGDIIRFSLFAQDAATEGHILVVDTNGDEGPDEGEESDQITSPSQAVLFNYTASTAGNIAYFCSIHGASFQSGTLVVQSPPAADNTLLIIGGVIGVIAVVGVAAVAMRMRKKSKPPTQPPSP